MSEVLGFRHRVTGEPIALARLFGEGEPSIHQVRHEPSARHEPGDVTRLAQFTLCGKVADDTASYAFQVLTRENSPVHWHFCRECRRYRGEDACE